LPKNILLSQLSPDFYFKKSTLRFGSGPNVSDAQAAHKPGKRYGFFLYEGGKGQIVWFNQKSLGAWGPLFAWDSGLGFLSRTLVNFGLFPFF